MGTNDQQQQNPQNSGAAEGEGNSGAATAGPELPEKFNSWDDLVKSYKELESKLGSQGNQQPQQSAGAEVQRPQQPQEPNTSASELLDQLASKEELSEEDYRQLHSRGLDQTTVDKIRSANQAQTQAVTQAVQDSVGGAETYQQIANWASQNLSDEELEAYNQAVRSGSAHQAKLAAQGLKAQYEASQGKDPDKRITGSNSGGSSGGEFYESWAQVREDMKSHAYKNDPAFRQKVEAKMRRSFS